MPLENGINYIVVSGFALRQAATQWAPPTAYQDGLIGPHWSKGWIIEDCEISESKCSGISLGKYYQKGNNNKLRVKSILKVANLPSYEKILSQRGSWESKIKDPFEKALDDLVKYEVLKSWKYAKKNEEDLTDEDLINLTAYHDWENLIILFEVKAPKDHKKRIARKKNRHKSGSKKPSSSKGEHGVAST